MPDATESNLQWKPNLRDRRLLCERPRRKGLHTTHSLSNDYYVNRAFFHSHSTPSHQHLRGLRASSGHSIAIALWSGPSNGKGIVDGRRDRAHRVGHGTLDPVAVQHFSFRATRKSFPINSDRALQGYTVALRGEAQMVSPASRTERTSFDHSRVLGAWICLLLQSAQPRPASTNIEYVILALSSLPGTIGQNFLRLRRAKLQ